jgi:hypothetical protein
MSATFDEAETAVAGVLDAAALFREAPLLPATGEPGPVLLDVPFPETVVGVVVGDALVDGVVVVVDGSTTLSKDWAVPEAQFTGEPPTACHVSPVTWMLREGYCVSYG